MCVVAQAVRLPWRVLNDAKLPDLRLLLSVLKL